MTISSLRWPLLAVLGLIVAVAVAILATRAVSTDIGISSESPSAGRLLSPAPGKATASRPSGKQHRASTTLTVTTAVPSPAPAQPAPGGSDGGGEAGDD